MKFSDIVVSETEARELWDLLWKRLSSRAGLSGNLAKVAARLGEVLGEQSTTAKSETATLSGPHCDDLIHDRSMPKSLRVFLLVHRFPAVDGMLLRGAGFDPQLYADHHGVRVRVTMASRLGDVGITTNLAATAGYQTRVLVSDLSNFGDRP